MGSHQRPAANRPTGNLTPPGISPSCPHCVILRSGRAVAGQEYHCTLCRSRAGSCPVFTDRRFSLIQAGWPARPMKESRWDLLIRAVPHGAASGSAFLLIALAKGKLPMNEYGLSRNRRKGRFRKNSFSPIVLKPWGCQPWARKKFFQFFDGKGSGIWQPPDDLSLPACRSAGWTGPGTHGAENAVLDCVSTPAESSRSSASRAQRRFLSFCRQFLQFFFQWPGRAAVHFL